MTMKRRLFLKLFALTGIAAFTNPLFAAQSKRATPTNVRELYAAMNAALPVGKSTCMRYSVTGEEYVEYATGIRADVATARALDPEAELCLWAWRTFVAQLAKLDDPVNARLYWRIQPEFDYVMDADDRSQACIYLRYLISSKPTRFSEDDLFAGKHKESQIG